jgi:hypothetical protein
MVRADHCHTALIEPRSNVLVATGVLGKTMGEQQAALGVVDGPVSILDTARETLHGVSAP